MDTFTTYQAQPSLTAKELASLIEKLWVARGDTPDTFRGRAIDLAVLRGRYRIDQEFRWIESEHMPSGLIGAFQGERLVGIVNLKNDSYIKVGR